MQCLGASNVTWIAWGLLLGCFACKRNVMAWSHSWKNSSAVWNSAGGLVLKHPQLFRNTRRAMGVEHSQSLWLLGLRTTMFERSWKHPDSTLLQKTSANFLPKKNEVWICKNWMHLGTSFFWKSYALDSTDRCIFNLNNECKGKRFAVWVSSRSLYSWLLVWNVFSMHGVSVPLRPKIGNLSSASPTRPGPLWCILPLPLCYTQKSGKQAFLAPTVRSGRSHFKTWAVSTASPSRGFSIDFGGWGITKHRKQDGQLTKSSLKSLTSEKTCHKGPT